jgi:hypothetical protein
MRRLVSVKCAFDFPFPGGFGFDLGTMRFVVSFLSGFYPHSDEPDGGSVHYGVR